MKKRMLISLLLLVVPSALLGQSLKKPVPEYDFARFERNAIVMEGDSSAFDTVWLKLDSILFKGAGNLRVMHIGGSHVQGGTFTKRLRNNMMSLRPMLDGGFGLVFPFSAARTNTPDGYVSRYEGAWTSTKNVQKDPDRRLGLTGMALSTSDGEASVTITTIPREPKPGDPRFLFNIVKVLGYGTGSMAPVILSAQGDTLRGWPDEADSTWTFELPLLSESVRIGFSGTPGEYTITGIFLDNPYPGISVTGVGVNGASWDSFAKCQDLVRALRDVKPDIVIVAIGVHDAVVNSFSKEDFISRYIDLVSQVRSVNPACALLFVTNNDSYRRVRRSYYVNQNALAVEDAFHRIAMACGGGVWNFFDIMGGLGSMQDWEEAGLAKRDKIHFTETGYELIGDLLYNALMDKYTEHLKRTR